MGGALGKSEELKLAIRSNGLADVVNILAADPSSAIGRDGSDSPLAAAARMGSVEMLKILLAYPLGKNDGSKALRVAVERGFAECAQLLIPLSDLNGEACRLRPKELAFDDFVDERPGSMEPLTPLCVAAGFGKLDCLRLLLGASKPSVEHASHALGWAAQGGHPDCVRELLPFADATAWESGALQRAAGAGSVACVELLIPASIPGAGNSRALRLAADNAHPECVRLLLPVSPGEDAGQALILAAQMECEESLSLILAEHPESAKAVDPWGFTALMRASMLGYEGCAKILAPLSDLKAASEGERAVDMADSASRESRYPELAAYLRELALSREEARLLEVAAPGGARPISDRRL